MKNNLIKNALRKRSFEEMTAQQKELLCELKWDVIHNDNSQQGYITLRNPETDKQLVISTDMRGRTALYSPWKWVTYDLDKMDYISYMTTPHKATPYRPTPTRVQRYIRARRDAEFHTGRMEQEKSNLIKLRAELEATERRMGSRCSRR